MQAASATQLFQSDTSLAIGRERAEKAARTAHGAEYGHPIWLGLDASALPSDTSAPFPTKSLPRDPAQLAAAAGGADGGAAKVIRAHQTSAADPRIWTAESGRIARATDLESGEGLQQLRKHAAPVSALASLCVGDRTLLFTASWDKTIAVWAASDCARPAPLVVLSEAAGDFIKALHVDPYHQCLLSGGSDRIVRLWDLAPLAAWAAAQGADAWRNAGKGKGDCPLPAAIGFLRGHTRPILTIVSLPPPPPDAPHVADIPTGMLFFSGDSMGRVLEVHVALSGDRQATLAIVRELDGQDTVVTSLAAAWRPTPDGEAYTADVWTASADKHVRRFPLSDHGRTGTAAGRTSHSGMPLGDKPPLHADCVLSLREVPQSILPLGTAAVAYVDWVVIGLAEGDLEIWHLDPAPTLVRTLEGHWHEVTYLGTWTRKDGTLWLVSAALDGTVRRWPWSVVTTAGLSAPAPPAPSLLTAEEEAELAELMDD